MNEEKIRILIADDHAVVRRGIKAMVDPRPDLELIGEAEDGEEVIEKVSNLDPDVILMDLEMPRKGGIDAIREIIEKNPEARILVLTSFSEDEKVIQAIKAGAMGYVLKVSIPQELIQSIRDVYQGEITLSPSIARRLLHKLTKEEELYPKDQLTGRELDVLKLIAKGMTNREISVQLHISEGTVRIHVNHILSKLNLSNRTQAALYALREGLTSLYPAEDNGK